MGWIYDLIKDSSLSPFQKECLVIAEQELIEARRERARLQQTLGELRVENSELLSEVRRLQQTHELEDEG